MKVNKMLKKMGACDPAVKWSKAFGKSFKRAWKACLRPEWLLWLLEEVQGDQGEMLKCINTEFNATIQNYPPILETDFKGLPRKKIARFIKKGLGRKKTMKLIKKQLKTSKGST